jgi:glycosyltransferase involved in cell wall biosynthesis
MKVLISAYACEPYKGSESAVGWNWALQAARSHEVWVVTRANNEPVISEFTTRMPLPNLHWIYYDLPPWARFWKKKGRGVHLYYNLWQLGALRIAKRLHLEVGFDIVHHATIVNYWLPAFLGLLPVPFVWGPVGGAESGPRTFYGTFGWRGRIFEHVRDAARWLGEVNPLVRAAARRCRIALATTSETAAALERLGCRRVRVLSQVAVDHDEFARLSAIPIRTSPPFRLVSVGSLLHLKGFRFALIAFAEMLKDHPDTEYWLVGEGPERRRLEQLTRDLGIADHVRFWGQVPRSDVMDILAECDALVLPSFHDSGSYACIEALAAGRPVICLDLGGPAELVTTDCGFKIAARNPEQVSSDLAAAMKTLAEDAALRHRLGEAGRGRVRERFFWDSSGDIMNEFYRTAALSQSSIKGDERSTAVPDGRTDVDPIAASPMHGRERLRVLMSAYACEPGRGSEPGVGWHAAWEMARHCDVTVLTRSNNRPVIEEALAQASKNAPAFRYYDLPLPWTVIKKWPGGLTVYYVLWQLMVRWRFRALLPQHDLVHHVTFNSVQFPGWWVAMRIPAVLGPLGGGMTCPPAYVKLFQRRRWRERIRTVVVRSLPYQPWWRLVIRSANSVLAANQETADLLTRCRSEMVPVRLETAITCAPDVHNRVRAERAHTRYLWLGSLLPWKAPILALMAFKRVHEARTAVELVMVGSGPEAARLKRFARVCGLEDAVHFPGHIAKADVNALLDTSDVFLFTSVRDTSGNVMIEAMSRGLPVIALAHQGAAEIGPEGVVLRVLPGNVEETVSRFAEAMLRLESDRELRTALGHAGYHYACEALAWSRYGEVMLAAYRDGVSKNGAGERDRTLTSMSSQPRKEKLPSAADGYQG